MVNKYSSPLCTDYSKEVWLVLRDSNRYNVTLIEHKETNIDKAGQRNENSYASLVFDIRSEKYSCNIISSEIGSRGLVTKDNRNQVQTIWQRGESTKIELKVRVSTSILSCYTVLNVRKSAVWIDTS